ncbi:MAG: Beta-glucanase precursor [Firmicutes bacterium ADurb.Bin419]|nr:MAG: Beta-glucanase precursor [Firmicutes bacterium ADurb.Bin419]
MTLKNLERASHTTKIRVEGLTGGSYDVLVDNNKVAAVNVTSGQKAVFNVSLGSNQSYNVKINLQGNNITPVVTATPTPTQATGSIVYGDVNGDNQVNSIDFGIFRMYLLGMIDKMNAENWQKSGDVNLDGSINSIDFALLRSYMLGIVKSLPVGGGFIYTYANCNAYTYADRGVK